MASITRSGRWRETASSATPPPHPNRAGLPGHVRGAQALDRDTDLRRLTTLRRDRRALVQRIVDRAAALPASERALVEEVFGEGKPVARIAAAVGGDARRVRRTVKRLTERVLSPRFAFVSLRRGEWPKARARVATLLVLHGRSMRAAAAQLGLSLHTVRRHAEAIEALYEAEAAAARDGDAGRGLDAVIGKGAG